MLVHNYLEQSAYTFPDKDAVWYNNVWFSFSKLNQSANKVAHHLINSGIKVGDRGDVCVGQLSINFGLHHPIERKYSG